jgi:hypothetical protein
VIKESFMTEEAREQETRFSDQVWDWRNTVVDKMLGLVPRRTAEHLINAQKEGILAVRSLLDRGVEALESDMKRVHDRTPRS